jgi:hypothetical protein
VSRPVTRPPCAYCGQPTKRAGRRHCSRSCAAYARGPEFDAARVRGGQRGQVANRNRYIARLRAFLVGKPTALELWRRAYRAGWVGCYQRLYRDGRVMPAR